MERYAVKLGTGRVTHALVQGSEHKPTLDLTARDILCNRWSKSGEVHAQVSDEVTCKGCADLLIDIAAYEALEDMAGTWSPVPAVANPHYACDTHGATCPTGEHVSHTAGNPYPGCDRCAQETPADVPMTCGYCTRACNGYHFGRKMNVPLTPFVETPADRHMASRCREVVGEHCHCTLEYGMPDGQRRPCMVCEPSGERTVCRFRARNGKRKPSARRGR